MHNPYSETVLFVGITHVSLAGQLGPILSCLFYLGGSPLPEAVLPCFSVDVCVLDRPDLCYLLGVSRILFLTQISQFFGGHQEFSL